MNIYQKIVEIRKSIDCFTKDKKSYNYSYVSGTQILAGIKEKMDELGVVLEPHVIYADGKCHIIDTSTEKKKSANYIVEAPMEYHWVNADDPSDRAICQWALYGQQDDISKAFGSSLTYSERYFMLKYFGIPTDELDPDAKGAPKGNGGKPAGNPPKQDAVSAAIDNIKLLVDELIQTPKKEATIEAIKLYVKKSDGSPTNNYNLIKDIETANAVLEELKKVKESK